MSRITGWPPGLLQDDSRELSAWFASRLGARHQVDLRCAEIRAERERRGPPSREFVRSVNSNPAFRLEQARKIIEAAAVPTLDEVKQRLGPWSDLEVCGKVTKPKKEKTE